MSVDGEHVEELRAIAQRMGGSHGASKCKLLRHAANLSLTSIDALVPYHDVLLFMLAHPETAAMRKAAASELSRVADAARAVSTAGTARARAKMRGSGIAWSSITIAFSHAIARWLVERYPSCVEIDSLSESGSLLVDCLRQALPPLEFDLVESYEDAPDALIAETARRSKEGRLGWLLKQFERVPCSAALRATLFDLLQVFLSLNPRDEAISRTFARGLPAAIYYHRGPLLRKVDVESLVKKSLPAAQRLSQDERLHLIDVGRAILAMLGRETDPLTHADPRYIRYYTLERGVAIALYSARPGQRNPLDSHIGYVLFKNTVPIAYGGGWPFFGTCKIGINIFAPFRGGESTFVMASILRVYARLFAVDRFVVEPYQFGAGNREGLESGAFWFYYRLGFRPEDMGVRDLASREFEQMQHQPGYRSPLAVLRRFTRSDLELVVVPGAPAACDPADLSRATTAWIGERFHADRGRAEAFALKRVSSALDPGETLRWNGDAQDALRAMAPLLAQIADLRAWPSRDKSRLEALIRAKGGDEYRYFALMAGFVRLRNAFAGIASRAPA
ncbi:MAG TPA: hypothetical protein VGK44_08835 [Casimicrobiaceae bacterium]